MSENTETIQIGFVSFQWAQSNKIPSKYQQTTTSTNDEAKKEGFDEAVEDGVKIYFTDHQTVGRGRQQNKWFEGEKGSALLSSWSFLLGEAPQPQVTAKLGLALIRSLQATWPSLIWNLKAPNDIYLNGKKVAGLLTETVSQGADHRFVVGLGMNVWDHPADVEFATNIAANLAEESPLIGDDWIGFLDRWMFELTNVVGQADQPLTTSDCANLKHYLNNGIELRNSTAANIETVYTDGSLQIGNKKVSWQEL